MIRPLRAALWLLNGRYGRPVTLSLPDKVTVLVACFHPARLEHLDAQVRNILKCRFVERLVLSNHNPQLPVAERLRVSDKRVVIVNQPVERRCGHRWDVAAQFDAEYYMVIDDDVWLFPSQLAMLFEHLLREPNVPHGFSGMIRHASGAYEFRENEERSVDYITEVYAVTRAQVERYREMAQRLAQHAPTGEMVESSADFVVISCAGGGRPRIHEIGRVRRSLTFNQPGVAVHAEAHFMNKVKQVGDALDRIYSGGANRGFWYTE